MTQKRFNELRKEEQKAYAEGMISGIISVKPINATQEEKARFNDALTPWRIISTLLDK